MKSLNGGMLAVIGIAICLFWNAEANVSKNKNSFAENENAEHGVPSHNNVRELSGIEIQELRITIENQNSDIVKAGHYILAPDQVEIHSFSLNNVQSGLKRQRRDLDQKNSVQAVGGIFNTQPNETAVSVATYTNHPRPADLKSLHKIGATVEFFSDGIVRGDISTPNYPNQYPNGSDVTWLIVYPKTNVIQLDILDCDMEECCDFLMVYEGYNKSSSVLGAFDCGFDTPNTIISTGPAVFIRFTSDCLGSGKGLKIRYENIRKSDNEVDVMPTTSYSTITTETNSTMNNSFSPSCYGTSYVSASHYYSNVISPGFNYPGYYPNNVDCQWRIQAYYGYVLEFETHSFSLDYYSDWVRIYNGYGTYNSTLIVELTGYISPHYTVASTDTNTATLHFKTDSWGTDTGFSMHVYSRTQNSFTTTQPFITTEASVNNTCPAETVYLAGYSGWIYSPGYPYNYANNLNCRWSVQTPYYTFARLTVESFHLANVDRLYVYDGYSSDFSPHLATLFGYINYGYTLNASSNLVSLEFVTYYEYPSYGFAILFSGEIPGNTDPTEFPTNATEYGCGEERSGNGTIISPNYPYYSYSNNLDCIWPVDVPQSKYVLFTLNYFDTEEGYDYVTIYQGTINNAGPLMAFLTGSYPSGTEILVRSNSAFMTFYTDSSESNPGFSIVFAGVDQDYSSSGNVSATTEWAHNSAISWIRGNKETDGTSEKIIGRDLWKGAKNRPQKKNDQST